MRFINTCIVDFRISDKEISSLLKLNSNILLCPPCKSLYSAVCGHPDMQIVALSSENTIVQKDLDINFVNSLKKINLNLLYSNASLTKKYPLDIILNCVILGDLFMHNLKYTDKVIIENLNTNIKKISVKQGYTKCSTAIVNNRAIMTSDKNIASALSLNGVDVLFLPPGDIELPGLDYGFIGGACGLLNDRSLAFFGNINRYKYGNEVKNFLRKHRVDAYCLSEHKLVDRGTLLCL